MKKLLIMVFTCGALLLTIGCHGKTTSTNTSNTSTTNNVTTTNSSSNLTTSFDKLSTHTTQLTEDLSKYNVLNGGFETGDLSGWQVLFVFVRHWRRSETSPTAPHPER